MQGNRDGRLPVTRVWPLMGDAISAEGVVVDSNWVEDKDVQEPSRWNPADELIRYLEALFEAGENVGYVVKSWQKDEKWLPADKGAYDRTAGELIEALSACGGDIGKVLGDYNSEAGAWIRFNPLDGKGVRNENVTEYRYALVESDSMEIGKQHALIRELELPVACLVHSGRKEPPCHCTDRCGGLRGVPQAGGLPV